MSSDRSEARKEKGDRRAAGRRSPMWLQQALGGLLVLTPALALLANGATGRGALVMLHLLIALACVLAMRLSNAHLERSGRALLLLAALSPLPAAAAVGLLPLPILLHRLLAPGVAAAFPDFWVHSLSMNPEATVDSLAGWGLLLGWVTLVGVWSAAGHRGQTAERAVVYGMTVLLLFALAHSALGARAILGIIPVNSAPDPFFAPFVNANFLGTVIVLTLPVLIRAAIDAVAKEPLWGLSVWTPTVLSMLTLAWIRSPGTLAAIAVQLLALVAALAYRGSGIVRVGLIGVTVLTAQFFATSWQAPHWVRESVTPRLAQWVDLPSLFAAHWFAGAGDGAFEVAYAPFRSIPEYARFPYAHSDPAEWVVETGLVGLVAVALMLRRFPQSTPGTRRAMWSLGLVGAAASACWNFPLQIPAIFLLFGAVVAVRVCAYDHAPPVEAGRVTRALALLALLQAPAALWQVRGLIGDEAVLVLESERSGPLERAKAARNLRWTAPWRPQLDLNEAWQARRDQRDEAAAEFARNAAANHPHDARTLRRAALVLDQVGHDDEALTLLDRAIRRDPNDYRTHAAKSRIHRRRTEGGEAISAWVEAMRHWPQPSTGASRPLDEGWELVPVGEFWLDALADAPGHWSTQLAVRLLRERQPELAMLALEQALRIDPVRQYQSAIWIDALLAQQRYAQAEALARDLLHHDEKSWRNWISLGRSLAAQGKHEQAASVYLDGLRAVGQSSDLAIAAIYAGRDAGGPDRALQIAVQVEVRLPADPYVGLAVARMHHAKGDLHLCRNRIDQGALRTHPATRDHAEPLWQACTPGMPRSRADALHVPAGNAEPRRAPPTDPRGE